MTRVVNLRKELYDIYIGRAGHGQDGYFGNPVVLGRLCELCGSTHVTSGETLTCFRTYFETRIEVDLEFKNRVLELRGKVLGCFCKPRPCHGDVIVEFLDEVDRNV